MSEPAPDEDAAAAAVADSIRSAYSVPLPTEDERLQREIDLAAWHKERHWRDEQMRLERERAEAAKAEQARREAQIAAAQARQQAQRERSEQIERMSRDRQLASLQYQSARQQAWQWRVQTAVHNTVLQQQRQALINDLEQMTEPPPAPPEPETQIVYIEEPQSNWVQPHRWFER